MQSPLEILKEVAILLEKGGIEHYLVGSLAAMYYGRPRFTNDIDLVVQILPDFDAYIASAEDIILKKLDFFREGGSEKHLIDIRSILAETEIDSTYLNEWIEKLSLQREWKLADQ